MMKHKTVLIALLAIVILISITMFGFSKPGRLIAGYPDTWSLSQGVREGEPIFVRWKEGLANAQDRSEYPFQIGVAVPLLNLTSEGLTTNEEADALWKLEDSLTSALAQDGEAVFVASITTGGMREFVFYAREWKPEYFERKAKEAFEGDEHDPQFMMQPDKDWDTYREFAR